MLLEVLEMEFGDGVHGPSEGGELVAEDVDVDGCEEIDLRVRVGHASVEEDAALEDVDGFFADRVKDGVEAQDLWPGFGA